jgi:hypothetical protein
MHPAVPCRPLCRHLYCLESNRACFRRLFSPDLFAAFIDIGAYQQQLQQYLPLANELHGLPAEQRQRLAAALDEARAAQAAGVKDAGGYRLLEVLGQGGFGVVYRACRCALLRAGVVQAVLLRAGIAAAVMQFPCRGSLMATRAEAPCQALACHDSFAQCATAKLDARSNRNAAGCMAMQTLCRVPLARVLYAQIA